MADVSTYSIKVGVTHTVDQDLAGLKSTLAKHFASLEQELVQPFTKVDKTIGLLGQQLEKLLQKSIKGLISERDISSAEKLRDYINDIAKDLDRVGSKDALRRLNLQALREGLKAFEQSAILSPSAYAAKRSVQAPLAEGIPGLVPELIPDNPEIRYINYKPLLPYERLYEIQKISEGHRRFKEVAAAERDALRRREHRDLVAKNLQIRQGLSRTRSIIDSIREGARARAHEALVSRNIEIRDARKKSRKIIDAVRSSALKRRTEELREGYKRAREIAGSERYSVMIRQSKELEEQYRKEAASVEFLMGVYKSASTASLKEQFLRLRARKDAGFSVGAEFAAIREVLLDRGVDPDRGVRLGPGSFSHAFRYGSQNAAYAIEDFLIASQYGGVKAGLRAITNNLTAITAAFTGALHPFLGAAAIAGVGIAGAALPSVYEALSTGVGMDEESMELARRSGTVSPDSMSLLSSRIGRAYSPRTTTSYKDLRGLLERKLTAEREVNEYEKKRGLIMSKLNDEDFRLAGEFVSDAERTYAKVGGIFGGDATFGAKLSNVFTLGLAPLFLSDDGEWASKGRSIQHIAEIDQAKEKIKAAGKSLEGLGNARQLQEELAEASKRFEEAFRVESDFYNRFTVPLSITETKHRIAASRGELVDPTEVFKMRRQALAARRDINMAQARSDLERKVIQNEFVAERNVLDLEFEAAVEAHKHDIEQRDLMHKQRMIEFEKNPLKKIEREHEFAKERVRLNRALTDEQKQEQIAGIEDLKKRTLKEFGNMPPLGTAIDVGSARDVELRQKYFQRESGAEQEDRKSEETLKAIVEEIRGLRNDIKASKPKVALVK